MAKETEEQIEARMEAARNNLAKDVQDKFNKDGDVDERDRRLESAGRSRRTEPVAKTESAKKAPVVTKEELAKSGLSLRDYMNKQKGLTRRDGSKTEKAPSKTTTETKPAVSKSADKPAGLMAKADKPAGLTATAGKPASKPAVSESYRSEGANKAKPAASAGKSMFQRIAEKETLADRIRKRGEDDLKSRGMKKGGSIDGIAKSGRTNCKTY